MHLLAPITLVSRAHRHYLLLCTHEEWKRIYVPILHQYGKQNNAKP